MSKSRILQLSAADQAPGDEKHTSKSVISFKTPHPHPHPHQPFAYSVSPTTPRNTAAQTI